MIPQNASGLAVLIPAYRPSEALVEVVRSLVEKQFSHIVLVDDGSGPDFAGVFARAAAFPGVQILRHAANLGKGAALKTGINHALCAFPDLAGIVTADADGQHHPDDVERVAESLLAHPGSLVLGCRAFRGEVPLRSRFGNLLTGAIMHALMGRKMADTQTGLRGIPAGFALRTLKIEATGYEFELEMLITAHQTGVSVVEEPIRTIYEAGNKSSHFNPIVDSMKIYFVLLRFGSVSLLTSLLDNLVFFLAYQKTGHVLTSQILGRVFAVAFNYSMVRRSVFYSKQRHRTVLPKYLLLVLVSGTVSYGGIRLLIATLGMAAVPAKLLVETILFFVNFAVQRLFIFQPDGPGAAAAPPADSDTQPPRRTVPGGLIAAVITAVLLAALAVEAYGFRTVPLFSQDMWEPIGLHRFTRFLGMYLGIALPLLLIVPWTFPSLIVAVTALGTVASVGVMPLAAVAFFLVSSCALGARLLGRQHDESAESQLFSTLLGIGVWIFLMTWTARLPIHYPPVWAALLAAPVLGDLRGTWRRLMRWVELLRRAELRCAGERAGFAALLLVLLAHWMVALLPEVSADGLAMHLAVPANIAAHHALSFEPARWLWAVMPMGADFVYSIVYLLGGEYAAHLVDFTLLMMLAGVLYYALRRWVSRGAAFLLIALFATTPMVQLVTGSLFVENLVTVMVLGMMAALWRLGETGERRYLYLAAALAGTAMATKFGALAFVALALPFLIWETARHWKKLGPRPAAVAALAAVLLLSTALPAYAIAWWKTANPIFPFKYDKFPSPLLSPKADLVDARYLRPLTWNTPFDLTFYTNKTYEGQNGSFGFQYLVLAPLAVAAIVLLRRRPAVSGGIVALGACILIMDTQPNARYLYPALPLFSVPFAAILGWASSRRRWLYGGLLGLTAAAMAVNLYFLPSASYYHRDFCLRLPFSRAERDRFRDETTPIRKVFDYYNRHDLRAGSAVMLTSDSANAGLGGDVYENHWHQFNTLDRIRQTATLPDMIRLMQSWHVQYFISPKPRSGDEIRPSALRELLERCTAAEFEAGDQYLARLEPNCRPPQEPPVVVVTPGVYDDTDPALLYRGDWTHGKDWEHASGTTLTWTSRAGSEVQIAFTGKALTYTYTKTWNRGFAVVLIDGVSQGALDLYSTGTEWQASRRFCCFPRGRHTAQVRAVGQADPGSKGVFIDLDSFIVE